MPEPVAVPASALRRVPPARGEPAIAVLGDAAPTQLWLDRALRCEIPCKQLEQWRGKVFFSGGVPREQQTAAGTAKGMPVLESDEIDGQ